MARETLKASELISILQQSLEMYGDRPVSVSYTHLTLPTNREV